MNKTVIFALGFLTALGLLIAPLVYAATLQGFQGGTGVSTSSAGDIGKYLQITGSGPLTFGYGNPTGATTTIHARGTSTGPAFTFATSGLIDISCATGTCTFTLSPTIATSSGGSAAGTSTNVQFNDSGSFAADSVFTYNSSSRRLSLGGSTSSVKIGTSFPTSSATSTTSFAYSGTSTTWTVPTGVTSVTINALGAAAFAGGTVGNGGSSTGTLAVTPGTVYYVAVGGRGSGTTGGFPGGGNGNNGGGGGMSFFSTEPNFNSSTVLLVAGGGGAQEGGHGGGLVGTTSTASGSCGGAGGGTQVNGGAGGSGATAGGAGTEGQGGTGATNGGASGGGGGGGFFGGGGGGATNASCGGGGGGGSGFLHTSLTGDTTTGNLNNTTGTVTLTYTQTSAGTDNPYSLAVAGHIITGGSTPTVASCGTNPSVAGNDTAGVISVGTGSVTACTLVFATAFNTATPPVCVLTTNSSTASSAVTTRAATSTIFGFNGNIGAGKIHYLCLGF